MELFISLFFLIALFGIIYFMVRGFLSESFVPNKVVRVILLFIIGTFVGGIILYLYSSFGVDSSFFNRIGILSSLIFILWLENKKNKSDSEDNRERNTDRLSRTLLFSSLILSIAPIVLNIFFN